MPQDKTRSLRALDALNFCNAGIQTGLGPFMSVFYTKVRHWNPGQIGVLIACQALSGALLQSAVGNLIDRIHHKRLLTAAAALTVSACAVAIARAPGFGAQIAVQLIIGIAVTVFPAATSAFALGMSGEGEISPRVARNETFTHAGNTAFALVAGIAGMIALGSIFYGAAVFAAGMAVSAALIRKGDVSFEGARRGEEGDGEKQGPKGVRDLLRDRRILMFTAGIVLFNVANAATLPLVGELLSKENAHGNPAGQIAGAVVVAEAVMVGVAAYVGKKADPWGRKPLFLAAFGFLAVRNGLTVASHNPYYLISLQALDGVAAAIYGVLLTLVTADLAKGTGRFNFLQGAIQSAMGMGAFLSNAAFGFIAKTAGFNVSFLLLAGTALGGGLFYYWRMPETRPEGSSEPAPAAAAG
jgi:MFS family permease